MIVWGGIRPGGRYLPGTDSWTATSTTSAPIDRYSHTAVWTGNEMIVWGGQTTGGTNQNLNTGGRYCAQPPPTPTPTPAPFVNISGVILYCSSPIPGPVTNVIVNLTGTISGSTLSDGSGNYTFSSLPSGGTYTITPSKTALPPGSAGINTIDVVATQRHFLTIGTPLTGCRVTAADVNGDEAVNTIDVVAIQRFFLSLTTGIANVGQYQFNPPSRSYSGIVSDQINQNYNTMIFGDVASPFVN
jgi:Dockerin type I domain